jgi:hypothetical protein
LRWDRAEVDELFDDTWYRLESQVEEAKQNAPETALPRRPADDMLTELLHRVRRIERNLQPPYEARRHAVGDVVTLPNGETLAIQDADDLRYVQSTLALHDALGRRVYKPPPGTIVGHVIIPTPTVTTSDERPQSESGEGLAERSHDHQDDHDRHKESK